MGWIENEAEKVARELSDDPGKAVDELANRIAKKYPGRTGKAIWMDVEGRDDKGVSVRVFERKANSLDLLLGRKSVGAAAFHKVQAGGLVPTSRVEVSIGVGASYWHEQGDWSPVAAVRLRF